MHKVLNDIIKFSSKKNVQNHTSQIPHSYGYFNSTNNIKEHITLCVCVCKW